MTTTLDRSWIERNPLVVVLGAIVVAAEVGLIASYVAVGGNTVTDWSIVLLPWVWIDVGVWAIMRTRPPTASTRRRWLAGAVAVAYFGLLAVVAGLVGPGVGSRPTSLRVALTSIPPGWAPTLLANTPLIRLSVVPYQLVGYVALAYLVYATILDAAESAITGVLGLLSCVSCTWPVIATVLSGLVGGGAALTAAASGPTYVVSTVVFVGTVGLLYWRPGFSPRATE
jgi:hypothetical protein